MKSFFNETKTKICIIAVVIFIMIFLANYQKANSEFNINDMSIVNIQEKKLLGSSIESKHSHFLYFIFFILIMGYILYSWIISIKSNIPYAMLMSNVLLH